ncbi:MAG: hypothetical protein FD157_3390 [Rhodocyclaceae bacterium]|nr:MAG: hypothetical protein FD157_3390 [Rhodocyclaceae bacterium]TNC99394.1 MAG: hypothetical protein FD118_3764 [Rhodocyclaceae bacterium]
MDATAYLASSLICQSQEKRRSLFAAVAMRADADNATEFPVGMHLPSVERTLAKNQMLALPDENLTLVCLSGELWLTRDGDREDYILGPGRSFAVRRGDDAIVQALRASRVRLAST